jgi:phosphoglycolate phosphatase-like HAD superfamily hydrolase
VAPAAVKLALDLDGVLGDTRPLWDAWLADASRRFHAIAELDPTVLPADRALAAVELDRWAEQGIGDWRSSLARFAEDHAAVHLRPQAPVSAALRSLADVGARLGAFTDAPEELARVALGQLGAARRIEALETGAGALERLLERLGPGTRVVASADELTVESRSWKRT